MHSDFIMILLNFARKNNLRFSYDYNDTLRSWRFRFQDQERTWGFAREITEDCFDTYAGNTADHAYFLIETMKKKIPTLY